MLHVAACEGKTESHPPPTVPRRGRRRAELGQRHDAAADGDAERRERGGDAPPAAGADVDAPNEENGWTSSPSCTRRSTAAR